jgi:hypothetical protein
MTVVTEAMQAQSYSDPSPVERDERRWDLWAWLTLAAAILLVVWPLLNTLSIAPYPFDGWTSFSESGFDLGGRYRLDTQVSGTPTLLRSDDLISAINGRPLLPDELPPLPPDLRNGQELHYTVQRGDMTFETDVTLVNLTPAGIARELLDGFLVNPGNVLFTTAFFVLTAAVFLLRPGNSGARYLVLASSFFFGIYLHVGIGLYLGSFPGWLAFSMDTYGWGWIYVMMPCMALAVLVFPVRKWPARRFPVGLPLLLIGLPMVISVTANALVWFGGFVSAARLLLPLTVFSGAVILIVIPFTLIHNLLTIQDPVARAQMRWVALGVGAGFILPMVILVFTFTIIGRGPVSDRIVRLGNIALIAFPLCLAIGILRYHLFDIDVIIRRTTQYVVVTGILLLVFFGLVVVLQYLFSRVTGQSSTPAVVLSTLAIAALFNPVRRRVQDIIDRRFFRQKYDAEKTLEAIAATVRNETDLDELTAELLRVIQETMQPASLSIWLRDPATEAWSADMVSERTK